MFLDMIRLLVERQNGKRGLESGFGSAGYVNPFQARPFECVEYWIFVDRGHLGDYVSERILEKKLLEVAILPF